MKKVINKRMYNTETAHFLGSWCNTEDIRDFSYVEEHLYRKRNGEFFLCGEGGPNSKYATNSGSNFFKSGRDITPMTFSEAQDWAEEHLAADTYEDIFGEVSEDGDRITIALSLPAGIVEAIRRAASQENMSLSVYIEKKLLS